MKFCDQCGNEMRSEQDYCESCGAKQEMQDENLKKEKKHKAEKQEKAFSFSGMFNPPKLPLIICCLIIVLVFFAVGLANLIAVANGPNTRYEDVVDTAIEALDKHDAATLMQLFPPELVEQYGLYAYPNLQAFVSRTQLENHEIRSANQWDPDDFFTKTNCKVSDGYAVEMILEGRAIGISEYRFPITLFVGRINDGWYICEMVYNEHDMGKEFIEKYMFEDFRQYLIENHY